MWHLHQVEGRGWNSYMYFMANLASMYMSFCPQYSHSQRSMIWMCWHIGFDELCLQGLLYYTPAPQSKNTVCAFQITCKLLSFALEDSWKMSSALQYLKASYQTLCPYSLLPWEWIDLKLDVKWKYLPCLTFAHTAFFAYCILTLLCTAEIPEMVLLWHVILGVLYKSTQIELKLDRQCFHDFIFVMVQRCKVRSYT